MTLDQLVSFVANQGFAIAVAVFLLWAREREIRECRERVEELEDQLSAHVTVMHLDSKPGESRDHEHRTHPDQP